MCTLRCLAPFLNTRWHMGQAFAITFVGRFGAGFSILAAWTTEKSEEIKQKMKSNSNLPKPNQSL